MRFFPFALLVALITASSCSASKAPYIDDETAIQDLENTAQWIFDQAYPLYKSYEGYQENSEEHWEYIRKIIGKYKVNSHAIGPDTGFPNAPLQAMFSVRKGRFGLGLACYRRKLSESGKIYEIWHKKIYCLGPCKDREDFTALVTISEGMFSERQVVHTSKQFVREYEYPDGTHIEIPITSKMAGALREEIRSFPDAFQDSLFGKRTVTLDPTKGWVWNDQ